LLDHSFTLLILISGVHMHASALICVTKVHKIHIDLQHSILTLIRYMHNIIKLAKN